MLHKSLAAAAGVLALLAGAGAAGADDTLRLSGGGDGAVLRLGFDGDASTELVYRRYGGVAYGGYRGGYGGYRGYYGGYRGGYGGYRGYYARPYYHGGFYRPYYAYRSYYPGFYANFYPRYYARPYYYSGFYGYGYPAYAYYPSYSYYGYPAYSYYGYGYGAYCPIGAAVGGAPQGGIPGPSTYQSVPDMPPAPGAGVPPAGNGTFPYDGGPGNPIPMPKEEPAPAPAGVPGRPAFPAKGLLVSLPAQTTGFFDPADDIEVAPRQPTAFAYPAYGEGTPGAAPRPVERRPTSFAYPAYGEDTRTSSFATDRLPASAGQRK